VTRRTYGGGEKELAVGEGKDGCASEERNKKVQVKMKIRACAGVKKDYI